MLTSAHQQFYADNGYVVVRGLFSPDEVARYRDHFMTLRQHGSYTGDFAGVNAEDADPLKRYPRMIHMHRWDEVSRAWLVDARLNRCLTGLLGREPYAVQTMLYFKPPGARPGAPPGQLLPEGQAGHVHGRLDGAGSLRRGQWLYADCSRQP